MPIPATKTAVAWNNQWWGEVVHKEKAALEPTVNTKSGTRYKTDPEIEVKNLRKSLAQIRTAVIKWQHEIRASYEGGEADDISQRFSAAIVSTIDRVS